MFYTEAYKERKEKEAKMMARWAKTLNANGGIADEHLARTTAILCENFLYELKNDPKLIAEDRIQTGSFKGINLALLGLITRVIPNLVGAELVGVQAMPTPKSPVFTMTWHKDTTKSYTQGKTGTYPDYTNFGDELWVTPISSSLKEFGGVDPYYTSNQVYERLLASDLTTGNDYDFAYATKLKKLETRGYLFPESVVIYVIDKDSSIKDFATYGANGNYVARFYITGALSGSNYVMAAANPAGAPITLNDVDVAYDPENQRILLSGTTATWNQVKASLGAEVDATSTFIFGYQYDAESEGAISEINFKITEETVGLIRRQLRGKYTVDAAQDVKVLHGINLDSELTNSMKNELMHEINHEIVTDLRKLAKFVKVLDFNKFINHSSGTPGAATTGNYDDALKLMADAIGRICAEIWAYGRMGYANFVVGNPMTLATMDRLAGFSGAGVSFSGKDLSFAGSLGGKIKFYHDPTFPENEILIGYKGSSALECGYMYCPYLPITATPTLYDPLTGDPSKIFYTRYGKTLKETGAGLAAPKSVILNGEMQYARLILQNFPGSQFFA